MQLGKVSPHEPNHSSLYEMHTIRTGWVHDG